MRCAILLGLTLLLAGCEIPPAPPPAVLPPPQIEVDIKESTQGLTFNVTFPGNEATQPNHDKRWRSGVLLTLTEEELGDFRKEVEFLLGRIDEAQQKQEKRNVNSLIESAKP